MPDSYYGSALADNPQLGAEADDWEVAMLGGVAFADAIGAGWFVFAFRSAKIGISEGFCLTAAGVGLGGNATTLGPDQLSDAAYVKIDYMKPFSIAGLHQSSGRIASVSAGVPTSSGPAKALPPARRNVVDKVSYGVCRVTADSFTTLLRGAGLGSGLGGFTFNGFWYSFSLNGNSINPIKALQDLWRHVQALSATPPPGDMTRFGPLSGIR